MLAVIGTSPFNDTSVAVGPFRSEKSAQAAAEELDLRGWNTEVVPLGRVADMPYVSNDEGVEA